MLLLISLTFRTEFVGNRGQMDGEVAFHSIHPFGIYVLRGGDVVMGDVRLTAPGGKVKVRGEGPTGATFSVFKDDLEFSGIPTFRAVRLEGVARGTDLLLTAVGYDSLEVQIFLSQDSPDTLVLRFPGAHLSYEGGHLKVSRGKTTVIFGKFRAFESVRDVPLKLRTSGDSLLVILGNRPKGGEVVVDPIAVVLVAGGGDDFARDIALDPSGNVVIAGYTDRAVDFAPSRTVFGDTGNTDVFVTKLSPDLSTHIATAIIGSPQNDFAYGLTVDSYGNVFVVGMSEDGENYSSSRVLMGPQSPLQATVTKLSPDLSTHLGTAVISSTDDDFAWDVVVVGGHVYVGGSTGDVYTFAPSRSIIGSPGGVFSAFVTELSTDLSTHVRTVIFGGPGMDWVRGIDTDSSSIFVGGSTSDGANFGPSRTVFGTTGSEDVFAVKLPLDLSGIDAVAVVGGSGWDYAWDMDLDNSGNVLLGGYTGDYSSYAPSRTIFGTPGGYEAFVTKLSNDLSIHVATAIVAGSDADYAYGVDADPSGDVLLVGKTFSSDIAPSRVDFQYGSYSGNGEAFMTALTPDMTTHIITYVFKSSEEDGAEDIIAIDSLCPAYITGWTGAGWNFTEFLPPTFGTTAVTDAFVIRVECPLGGDDELAVGEREAGWDVEVLGGTVRLTLGKGTYVGYALYTPSGKLVAKKTLGYLTPGRYDLKPTSNIGRGTYFLVLRAGDTRRVLKVIRR